jgi:hypothetical protein
MLPNLDIAVDEALATLGTSQLKTGEERAVIVVVMSCERDRAPRSAGRGRGWAPGDRRGHFQYPGRLEGRRAEPR